jgi:hypothetical protein
MAFRLAVVFFYVPEMKKTSEGLSFFEMISDAFYVILCFYLRSIDVLERAGDD